MAGSRHPDTGLLYPVSEPALRHHAGVERETATGKEAYASFPDTSGEPYQGVLD